LARLIREAHDVALASASATVEELRLDFMADLYGAKLARELGTGEKRGRSATEDRAMTEAEMDAHYARFRQDPFGRNR
jgi:hypothetical protein